VYLPSLRGAFLFDDDLLLTNNPLIQASDGLYRFWFTTEAYDYWPLSSSTLWIEWRLWGMNPLGYRLTNLFLHIGTVVLLWRVLGRLAIPGATLAALLFAVHPVNVETVAWIAQRKSLLALLFSLLSALWYLDADKRSPRSTGVDAAYGLSLFAFVLAMLSKVSAAVVPPLLLVLVGWRRPSRKSDLIRITPFFVVLGVLLWVNLWFRTHGADIPAPAVGLVERLLGAAAAVWFYLWKAVLPLNLIFIYPEWEVRAAQLSWWIPLAAAATVTAILWWYRHSWSRAPLFSWIFFGIALAPVLGFTNVGASEPLLLADHYQHTALLAVVTLSAAAWATWQRRLVPPARWLPNTVAAAIVLAFMLLAGWQSRLYADPIVLYRDTLARNPAAWRAHNNLAVALDGIGQIDAAIAHYQQTLRLRPDYADAHNNLGTALTKLGQREEALQAYEHAVRLKPDFPEAHYNLGSALAAAGRADEALASYQQAVRHKPAFPEAHFKIGRLLAQAQRLPEAIAAYEEALRLRPDFREARNNLAILRSGAK